MIDLPIVVLLSTRSQTHPDYMVAHSAGFERLNKADEVYLWYDPGLIAVIQDEITPGLYAGVFDEEEKAIYFIEQYQDRQGLDPNRLELYRAEWEKIGSGDSILGQG